MKGRFFVRGAVTAEKGVYLPRTADTEVVKHLRAGEYVLLTAPRQQGKTSLLRTLEHDFRNEFRWAYVDVSDTDPDGGADAWLSEVSTRILEAIQGTLPEADTERLSKTANSGKWREFLRELARIANSSDLPIIIAVDETSWMVGRDWSRKFFATIRALHQSHVGHSPARRLLFVFSGTFRPIELMPNPLTSPFNVAESVTIENLSAKQVLQLTNEGNWDADRSRNIAEKVAYWTAGQPYLVQYILSKLPNAAAAPDVDAVVSRLILQDLNHLPYLIALVNKTPGANELLRAVAEGNFVKHYSSNELQDMLLLYGILTVKGSSERLRIANNLYQRVFCPLPIQVFISYPRDYLLAAIKVSGALQAAGIPHWFDQRLKAGAAWPNEIKRQLSQSAACVVVWGTHAALSEWVKKEIALAHGKKIPIIPAQAVGHPGSPAHSVLSDLHFIGNVEENLVELIDAVRKTLENR